MKEVCPDCGSNDEIVSRCLYCGCQWEYTDKSIDREMIEWHKYPDEKPSPSDTMHLITHKEIGVTDMWWLDTEWEWDDENITAWAEMPKGYND